MVKTELIRRSPLRILEESTRGGPGKGNLGAIVAQKGVGKTAFLVHLSTFQLLQDRQVIHVSFSSRTDHIVDWYEEIFAEITQRYGLEDAMQIHDEMIRHRVIMNFNQQGVEAKRITESLKSMIGQGHFPADLIVVDGYDFSRTSSSEIVEFLDFARDMHLEIWFSVSLGSADAGDAGSEIPGLLEPHQEHFASIIAMRAEGGFVWLRLLKDHDAQPVPDLHLRLDPKVLLVSE